MSLVSAYLFCVMGCVNYVCWNKIMIEGPIEIRISRGNSWYVTALPYTSCHRACNNCSKTEVLRSVNQVFPSKKGCLTSAASQPFYSGAIYSFCILSALPKTGRNQCALWQDGGFQGAAVQGTGMLLSTFTWGFIAFSRYQRRSCNRFNLSFIYQHDSDMS